jgi:DNA-binding response OmpR family regulator
MNRESADNETPAARDEPAAGPRVAAQRRRALLVADDGADAPALRDKLAAAGLEVETASAAEAARRAAEAAPSVVVLAFGGREGEGRMVSLARRLRAEPASFSLPVVFIFREDGRTLRSAAAHFGADDYCSHDAPAEEIRARLASLFWRAEAGRRNAPASADQRGEIDNFIFLLDSVGADLRRGAAGSVALLEAEGEGRAGETPGARETRGARLIKAAHSFLKLNLRRLDAVAFYGPSTLLVYLPNADAGAARTTLARLCEEFSDSDAGARLFAGLSPFASQGLEVEALVEQAEAALARSREPNSQARVVVYGEEARQVSPPDAERRAAPESVKAATSAAPTATGAPNTRREESQAAADDAKAAGAQADGASGDGSAGAPGERRAGARVRRLMLVVSDAARMAQVNLLLRSEGFEVRAAFDGHHALNLLRIDRPDLLVVDYELREMDGVEMLRRLAKQSRAGHSPPALMLVPAGREDVRGEAMAAGARSLVELPYDPVELLDALRDFRTAE